MGKFEDFFKSDGYFLLRKTQTTTTSGACVFEYLPGSSGKDFFEMPVAAF
jgi:hypothetical protein